MGNKWGTEVWDDKWDDSFALELNCTLHSDNNQTFFYKDIFLVKKNHVIKYWLTFHFKYWKSFFIQRGNKQIFS